jgi:bifunctional non-homologous end joining protein LigD
VRYMIEPMLAQLTHTPLDLRGTWLLEPKYDGERIIAECKDGKINLWTRRHVQVSHKFPEIVEALDKLSSEDWVLDGELTVAGGFRQLLKRNVEDPFKIKILAKKIPSTYNVFDILRWEGEVLLNKPLLERKSTLLKALPTNERLDLVPFQEAHSSTLEKVFQDHVRRGYEGIILKEAYSSYEVGKRPGSWLKLKREDTVDVNVIGATYSTSSLPFGALIMERDGIYFGKVGTGFGDQDRKEILKILEDNQGPLQIDVPKDVKREILLTTKPIMAEIRVNQIYHGSPRAPVWVRFRWDDLS